MSGLKVFISSTMNDLVNEREGVAKRLLAFNCTPVRAEELSPDGTDSWSRIYSALVQCDVVVLILGESYGWCPDSGPHGGLGLSVTELEFREARRLGIPVLPFFMKRRYSTAPATDDQLKRDRFRTDVEAWAGGLFRAQFENAFDLSEAVGRAVVSLLTDRFRTLDVRQRRSTLPTSVVTPAPTAEVDLPSSLVSAAASRHVTLLVGAGASLAAGIPAVPALTEALVEGLRDVIPDYSPPQSGTLFNAVATDFESVLGIDRLHETIGALLDSELYGPLPMHETISEIFDVVLTTNYDSLLERADPSRPVVTALGLDALLPERALVKLHGSVDVPRTMVATENDLALYDNSHAALLRAVVERLRAEPTLVLGSSLRDPSIVRLLTAVGPRFSGWIVSPDFTSADRQRLARWRLVPIAASAANFVDQLALALERRKPSVDARG